jgi:FMN phosphatase YigB (HAD superfamily)
MKKIVAFDLDETLGVPIVQGSKILGFNERKGMKELLEKVGKRYEMVIWTVSNRTYLDKILKYGLNKYFTKTYSWDEISCNWKDIRKIKADYLIDDSPHHKTQAAKFGLEHSYIIIPAYGSLEDQNNPLLWVDIVQRILL